MRVVIGICFLLTAPSSRAAYYQVSYAASTNAGELALAVDYVLWMPPGVRTIRSVIVHQHGCGAGASEGGRTAAYDLHWQALAARHNAALLGPSYKQRDSDACQLWSDPKNGSGQAFLQSLSDFAAQTGHPELREVPWCLWGHSGGGAWAGGMAILHPDRVVGVWHRSGASPPFRLGNEALQSSLPEAVLRIPTVCNPGVKERTGRFEQAWAGLERMFLFYRERNAPVLFAPDPRTSHECGDSRYLAIPFFDWCLRTRLSRKAGGALRPVNLRDAYYAAIPGSNAVPAARFQGDLSRAAWLPDESLAKKWQEYVTTGTVSDKTPPPRPRQVRTTRLPNGHMEIVWEAEADFESGIGAFIILRNGTEIGRVPVKPDARMGRSLFQGLSYHDTPTEPLADTRFVDRSPVPGEVRYEVVAVNSAGLRNK